MTLRRKKFTFIDLFAGIGGIRIGFERAGGKCVFTSEWDEAAQKMYQNYFGDKPHGDITKIDEKQIPDHTILTGGFPCQAFSIIGGMRGFADTRGTLFFDVERIIKEKRPQVVFLENVRNLASHDHGRTLKIIVERLEDLGYFVHYKVLNGLHFGVPQKRERIMIVAFQENHPFEFPKKGRRPIATLESVLQPDHEIDDKHLLSPYAREKLKRQLKEQKKIAPKEPSIWHENKSGNIGIHPFSCALRANASYNYLVVDGKRRLTPREMFRLQGFPDDYEIIVPDSQARKQAGNAVVVPQMEAMAFAILDALAKPPIPEAAVLDNSHIAQAVVYS